MNNVLTSAIAQRALVACDLDAEELVQKHFGDFGPFETRAAKAASAFALEIASAVLEEASPVAFGLFGSLEREGSETRSTLIGMAIGKLSGQLAHRNALDQLHHPGRPEGALTPSAKEALVKAGAAALAIDMSTKSQDWTAISSLGIAAIAVRHMGNPIPPAAYALAREVQTTMRTKFAAAPVILPAEYRPARRPRP